MEYILSFDAYADRGTSVSLMRELMTEIADAASLRGISVRTKNEGSQFLMFFTRAEARGLKRAVESLKELAGRAAAYIDGPYVSTR